MKRSAQRGVSFLEVLATMAVLVTGMTGAALVVGQTSKQNRRALSEQQALLIADVELERIRSVGCDREQDDCLNLHPLDGTGYSVWQTAAGETLRQQPAIAARRYDVRVDVDPPFEGTETGSPALGREVRGVALFNDRLVNVRVVVSWTEPGEPRSHSVVLQTRLTP